MTLTAVSQAQDRVETNSTEFSLLHSCMDRATKFATRPDIMEIYIYYFHNQLPLTGIVMVAGPKTV